jgi:hypothetical protein
LCVVDVSMYLIPFFRLSRVFLWGGANDSH